MAISFAAGETITAAKLNRLQPTTHYAIGSGTVAAGSVNALVPSASVTFTTLGNNAVMTAHAVWDVDLTGATTATLNGTIVVNGGGILPLFSFSGEVTTDRATIGQNYRFVLTSAGVYTIAMRVTTGANQQIWGPGSSILVNLYEQE